MKDLSKTELLVELKALRAHLEPVLNSRCKNVLAQLEKLLQNKSDTGSKVGNKSMTKEQILSKWLNKY